MRLENKVAIVTGGAYGIGKAIAFRLAEEGAAVVVGDIDFEGAQKVVQELEAKGHRAIATKTDVSKSAEAEAMANAALAEFGKIDILVNNAGGADFKRRSLFKDSVEEVWDYVIGRNLKGVRNCTRAVINHMVERQTGKIVNIASISGVIGTFNAVDYSAAKAGIIGFSMALAKEVARYGILVNCVSPGVIDVGRSRLSPEVLKEMERSTGLGRRGKPEEIAAMVAFLASAEADYISGQNYIVGGLRNLGA
ncbi:MAG: SDR family oxidoreductase [Dehalococcoidales bacterium]|nr:SDR family oxidoreductase [Dehalococcoidales bacterium]